MLRVRQRKMALFMLKFVQRGRKLPTLAGSVRAGRLGDSYLGDRVLYGQTSALPALLGSYRNGFVLLPHLAPMCVYVEVLKYLFACLCRK